MLHIMLEAYVIMVNVVKFFTIYTRKNFKLYGYRKLTVNHVLRISGQVNGVGKFILLMVRKMLGGSQYYLTKILRWRFIMFVLHMMVTHYLFTAQFFKKSGF